MRAESLDAGALALSVFMAVAAGLVGSFAVMRRMSLAADALSHVALPGIGLAFALGVHPFLGALAMLILGAALIFGLERRANLATETVTGVVFSAALAVGSLVTPGDELIEALFGGMAHLTLPETTVGILAALAIVVFAWLARERLVIALVSPEVARTLGIDVNRLDLGFLVAFAVTVALGLRYLGVLLMGALLIVPAATAKRLARSLHGMLATSVAVALFATLAGGLLAMSLDRPGGPLIVCVAALCFAASLVPRIRA